MYLKSTLAFLFLLFFFCFNSSQAQSREQGPWWPHELWGKGDQAGASNWITPDKIIKSLTLVETGKVYELGFPYSNGMPLLAGRTYSMILPGSPTGGPYEGSGLAYNDEFLCTQIGQVGTQFDGPGHIGQRVTMQDGTEQTIYYNGFTQQEVGNAFQLQKLGVEHVKPFITRGILLDVAGYKGVETLVDSYLITMDDVRGALNRQGIDESSIEPGDALLFNTGWWRLIDDHDAYLRWEWAGWDQMLSTGS